MICLLAVFACVVCCCCEASFVFVSVLGLLLALFCCDPLLLLAVCASGFNSLRMTVEIGAVCFVSVLGLLLALSFVFDGADDLVSLTFSAACFVFVGLAVSFDVFSDFVGSCLSSFLIIVDIGVIDSCLVSLFPCLCCSSFCCFWVCDDEIC